MSFQSPPPSPPPHEPQPAHVFSIPLHDVQWNRPVFRAPSLPLQPRISELPFTTQFRVKDTAASKSAK